MPLILNTTVFTTLFELFLTLTITVFLNFLLRSYIRVPQRLESKRGKTYVAIIKNFVSAILFTVALHIIFIVLKINIIPLVASAGLIGIILGVGARPFVEDLIAGFFLLTQASISIGDYVNVGSDIEGTITDIGFRTVSLRGVNGAIKIISNGQIKQVINYSRGHAVVYVDIPVKAGQNIDNILKILRKSLKSMEEDKNTDYNLLAQSRVWGIQNIQIPNCILIRVVLVTTHYQREDVDKAFRYLIVKEFEKEKLQFA